MKALITESQLKDIIKSHFGVDLTNKIHIVTNKWELPMEFDGIISPRQLNLRLNRYGPMYVIEIGKEKYLAQYVGKDGGWEFVNQVDVSISEFELMRILGIQSLGLTFDDLLNQYFDEKTLNEEVTEEPEDNMTNIIQSYLDMNIPNYYAIKRFVVNYNEQFDQYDIHIFFDRQIAVDMGGGINMLLRNAKHHIFQELTSVFSGAKFDMFQNFED